MPVPRPRHQPRRAATPRSVAVNRLAKRLGLGERELIDAAASMIAIAIVSAAFVVPSRWWWMPTTLFVRWPIEAVVAWTLNVAGVWPARVAFFSLALGAVLLVRSVNMWAMSGGRRR